jgi:hypothetical protein
MIIAAPPNGSNTHSYVKMKISAMKHLLSLIFVLSLFNAHAQQKESNFFLSPSLYVGAHNPSEKNTNGYGIHVGAQHVLSKNFFGTATLGYVYIKGEFVDFDGNTENHFALLPVLIGLRYNIKPFFASFEIGAAIRASANAKTRPALVPAIGASIKKFDFFVKLFGVPETSYGVPEQSYLQRGGYSYFQFGAAYHF